MSIISNINDLQHEVDRVHQLAIEGGIDSELADWMRERLYRASWDEAYLEAIKALEKRCTELEEHMTAISEGMTVGDPSLFCASSESQRVRDQLIELIDHRIELLTGAC